MLPLCPKDSLENRTRVPGASIYISMRTSKHARPQQAPERASLCGSAQRPGNKRETAGTCKRIVKRQGSLPHACGPPRPYIYYEMVTHI